MIDESDIDNRLRQEVDANRLSLCASLVLGILNLVVALAIDSVALMLGSSAYLVDVVVSLFMHRAILTIDKSPDSRYHFGYGKYEPLVATASGLSILTFCVMSVKYAIQDIIHPDEVTNYDMAVWLGAVSCVLGLAMAWRLVRASKRLNSQIIRLHSVEWLMDAVLSLGLCVGFFGAKLLSHAGYNELAALADPVLSLILAAVLCGPPIRIICENISDLLDINPGGETEIKALELAREAAFKHGFAGVERVRLRRSGRKLFMEVRVMAEPTETSKATRTLAREIESQAAIRLGQADTIVSFAYDEPGPAGPKDPG